MQDVRYALRQLRRNPGFAIAAILTLGLGIGANTAVFSIVNTIFLKPLPYKNSDRLVRIVENIPASESFSGLPERTIGMSPTAFEEWRSKTKTLSAMAMARQVSMTMMARQPVRFSGLQVSPGIFSMLGVSPMLGRVFDAGEEKPGSDKVAIISHAVWANYFGADAKILGQLITLDETKYTIVGVMPLDFIYPDAQTEFWIPLALPVPNILGLPVIARLKDNVPLAAAADEATNIAREFRGESPNDPQPPGPPRIQLMSVRDELVQPIRLPFLVFVIAVTFVLLVACVNVANLFLARTMARRMEIAIRMSIGASASRVLRQLLTENFIIASFGGLVGVGVAFAGSRMFVALGQSLARSDLRRFELAGNAIPRLNEVTIDASVLMFALGLTVVTGLLFGIIPALQIRWRNPIEFVKSRHGASNLSTRFVRSVLVTGQIGFTMVLLLAAGLLIKSFVKLASRDLGYDATNVLTFKIPQPPLDYPRDLSRQLQQNAFAEDVVRRVASMPGVQAAAFTNELPMVQGFFRWLGRDVPTTRKTEGRLTVVSHDYFRTMRVPLIAGRAFGADDYQRKRPVYIINKAAAREYFPGVNPIGKTTSGAGLPSGEIIGIVDDIRQSGLEAEPVPQLFLHPNHVDAAWGNGYYFVIRTTNEVSTIVPAIRSTVRDVDPNAIVDSVATMDQIVSNSITTPRSYAVLLGMFSFAALVLALIGLYGLLAYLVKQRMQEFGVRVALGAESHHILFLVLKQGLALNITGIAFGLVGGVLLTRYLQNMLFGISALDFGTFFLVSVLFTIVTIAAIYAPARQATNADPLVSLRCD